MGNFAELGLSKPSVRIVEEIGFNEPTDIQAKTIPLILSGRDIMASAQTGSGKTAAYALPIIDCLEEASNKPRALILVPTRELALQVEAQFVLFAKYAKLKTVTLYGGTGYEKQTRLLRRGVDVIVATPGRLMDHVDQKTADLSGIEILVLDEADRMLDMGFLPQVRRILTKLTKDRQTLMFSATIDKRVERIAAEYLSTPVTVRVNNKQVEPTEIEQKIFRVNEFGKDALLAKLIQDKELNMASVIVFTKTRRKATWVKSRLRDANIMAEEIHGDISQSQRERTLAKFREGTFSVLVATDVAARGLDVPSISHVINYDLPEVSEDYVHRIGRTGRAGRTGVAFSFVSEEQSYLIRDIEKITGKQLDPNGPKPRSLPPRRFTAAQKRRII